MARRFLLVVLTLGDDNQDAGRDRLPRAIGVIYEAFPLKTVEGLIRRMSVHRPLVTRYTVVNPDMIIVRIEEQPFMLAGAGSF